MTSRPSTRMRWEGRQQGDFEKSASKDEVEKDKIEIKLVL